LPHHFLNQIYKYSIYLKELEKMHTWGQIPCDYDVSIPLQGKNTNSIPIFSIEIEPYLHSKTFDAIRENNPNGCYK